MSGEVIVSVENQEIDRVRGTGKLGPLILIVMALVLGLLYLSLTFLIQYIVSVGDYLTYSLITSLMVMVAPFLFLIGVVLMDHDRRMGYEPRVKMSTVGGVTLLAGAIFGITYSAFSIYNALTNWTPSFEPQSFQVSYLISIAMLVVGTAGALIGGYHAIRRRSFLVAMLAGSLSVLLGLIIWPMALIPIVLARQEFETDLSKREGKGRNAVIIGALIIASMMVLVVATPLAYQAYREQEFAQSRPVHDGDVIVWSVTGNLGGESVSGSSTWTFSNTTVRSDSSYHMYDFGPYQYSISIDAIINGKTTQYYTAGAYNDSRLWSLGINPTKASEIGYSGYYNGNPQTFVQNEVIDTAFGQKNTAVYYEVFGDGSGDMWSKMWIDAENGLPYRITMNEPATLNGYVNEFRGNVTYELVSTTISH